MVKEQDVVERRKSLRLTEAVREELLDAVTAAVKVARKRPRPGSLTRALTEVDPSIPVLFSPANYGNFAAGYLTGDKDPMHYLKGRAHARNPYKERMYDSPCVFHLYDVWRLGYHVACWVKLPAARRTPTGRPKKGR